MKDTINELKNMYKNYSVENNEKFKKLDENLHNKIYVEDMAKRYNENWYKKGTFVAVTNIAKEGDRSKTYLSNFNSVLVWIPVGQRKFEENVGRNLLVQAYKIKKDIYPYLEEVKIVMRDIIDYSIKEDMRGYFETNYVEFSTYKQIEKEIDKYNIKIPYLMTKKIEKELKRYEKYKNGNTMVYKESDYGLPQGYLSNGFPNNRFACIPYKDLDKLLKKSGIDLDDMEYKNRLRIETSIPNKQEPVKKTSTKNVETKQARRKVEDTVKKDVPQKQTRSVPRQEVPIESEFEDSVKQVETLVREKPKTVPSTMRNTKKNINPITIPNKKRRPMNTNTTRYNSPILTDDIINQHGKK